jgi:hypothetical protein
VVKSPKKRRSINANINLGELETSLRSMSSREEGFKLLESFLGTKKALEHFAREIDTPLLKSDKIDLIKKKIIEATIGYRLRSNSIQNK